MGRPAGHLLNKWAWDDVLRLRGLSLTEVATRAELPRPTLSSLLHGHHKASVPNAHRIAEACDVAVETLFPTLSTKFEYVDVEAKGAA